MQRVVARVLGAIYEADSKGFSYGFRPDRGQHHALDAVAVAIHTKKVGWVLDADICGISIYAWSLLTSHIHLLFRSGAESLSSFMRRLLGTGDFVESVLDESDTRSLIPPPRPQKVLPDLLSKVAGRVDVADPEIRSPSRRRPVPMARALVSYVAVRHLGLTVIATARYLHVSPQSVLRGIDRGPDILRRIGCTAADLTGHR